MLRTGTLRNRALELLADIRDYFYGVQTSSGVQAASYSANAAIFLSVGKMAGACKMFTTAPPSNVEVKQASMCNSNPPYAFKARFSVKHKHKFAFFTFKMVTSPFIRRRRRKLDQFPDLTTALGTHHYQFSLLW